MMMGLFKQERLGVLALLLVALLALSACGEAATPPALPAGDAAGDTTAHTEHHDDDDHAHDDHAHGLDDELPHLAPLALAEGERVQVVATTNLVADVVAQVGGDRIELIALMPPGADPHGYTPTPQDLRLLNDARVIFINGLGLEEGLLPILTNLDREVPLVSVNVGVQTVEYGDDSDHAHDSEHEHDDAHHHDDDDDGHGHDDDHAHHDDDDDEHGHDDDYAHHDDDDEHGHDDDHAHHDDDDELGHDDDHHHDGGDPHTWQSVHNVMVWVSNVEAALSALDPDHASVYAANAQAYLTELSSLEAEIREMVDQIPVEKRRLVTDHETYRYYALDYGFEVIGAVIPGFSTLAAASAQELAALQDQMVAENVQAIFVGSTVNPGLAQRMAEDLGLRVVPLYSDSLSDADGPAASYVAFMRYNTTAIVEALR